MSLVDTTHQFTQLYLAYHSLNAQLLFIKAQCVGSMSRAQFAEECETVIYTAFEPYWKMINLIYNNTLISSDTLQKEYSILFCGFNEVFTNFKTTVEKALRDSRTSTLFTGINTPQTIYAISNILDTCNVSDCVANSR